MKMTVVGLDSSLSVEEFLIELETAHCLWVPGSEYFLQLGNICACTGNTRHSSLSLQLQFCLSHVTIELNVQSADRMRASRSHSVVGIRSRLPDPREHDFSVVDVASVTTSLSDRHGQRPPTGTDWWRSTDRSSVWKRLARKSHGLVRRKRPASRRFVGQGAIGKTHTLAILPFGHESHQFPKVGDDIEARAKPTARSQCRHGHSPTACNCWDTDPGWRRRRLLVASPSRLYRTSSAMSHCTAFTTTANAPSRSSRHAFIQQNSSQTYRTRPTW